MARSYAATSPIIAVCDAPVLRRKLICRKVSRHRGKRSLSVQSSRHYAASSVHFAAMYPYLTARKEASRQCLLPLQQAKLTSRRWKLLWKNFSFARENALDFAARSGCFAALGTARRAHNGTLQQKTEIRAAGSRQNERGSLFCSKRVGYGVLVVDRKSAERDFATMPASLTCCRVLPCFGSKA